MLESPGSPGPYKKQPFTLICLKLESILNLFLYLIYFVERCIKKGFAATCDLFKNIITKKMIRPK